MKGGDYGKMMPKGAFDDHYACERAQFEGWGRCESRSHLWSRTVEEGCASHVDWRGHTDARAFASELERTDGLVLCFLLPLVEKHLLEITLSKRACNH